MAGIPDNEPNKEILINNILRMMTQPKKGPDDICCQFDIKVSECNAISCNLNQRNDKKGEHNFTESYQTFCLVPSANSNM